MKAFSFVHSSYAAECPLEDWRSTGAGICKGRDLQPWRSQQAACHDEWHVQECINDANGETGPAELVTCSRRVILD